MKKILMLPLAVLSFGFTTTIPKAAKKTPPPGATAGVYIYFSGTVNSFGLGDALNGHADELQINNYTGAETITVTAQSGAGGATVSHAAISDLVIDKLTDKTTQRLRSKLLGGGVIADFELRIYNGTANGPVYKIVMTNSYITNITSSAQLCASGNCTELHELISVHPIQTIAWYNYPIQSNGSLGTPQIVTHNITTNLTTQTGL